MYICDECGETRKELDTEYFDTGVRFQDGNNGFEQTDFDCSCGGTYVEAERCGECSDWADPDKIHNGVCENCLSQNVSIENAELLGMVISEPINVNSFYARVFGESQINHILMTVFLELSPFEKQEKAKAFLMSDKDEFAKFVKEWL